MWLGLCGELKGHMAYKVEDNVGDEAAHEES